jgi:hypothetical protein
LTIRLFLIVALFLRLLTRRDDAYSKAARQATALCFRKYSEVP